MKLNTDGSWLEEDSTGEAVMIIRDCTWAIIFASCRFIPHYASVLEAEIAAIMKGVSLALDRSIDWLLIETECMAALVHITWTPAHQRVNYGGDVIQALTHNSTSMNDGKHASLLDTRVQVAWQQHTTRPHCTNSARAPHNGGGRWGWWSSPRSCHGWRVTESR